MSENGVVSKVSKVNLEDFLAVDVLLIKKTRILCTVKTKNAKVSF